MRRQPTTAEINAAIARIANEDKLPAGMILRSIATGDAATVKRFQAILRRSCRNR